MNYEIEIPQSTIDEIERRLNIALQRTGFNMERYAKQVCPVDTGKLRSSIRTEAGDMKVTIGTNVKYAPHVEYGTHKMRPQPFLRPAVHRGLTQYLMENIKREFK